MKLLFLALPFLSALAIADDGHYQCGAVDEIPWKLDVYGQASAYTRRGGGQAKALRIANIKLKNEVRFCKVACTTDSGEFNAQPPSERCVFFHTYPQAYLCTVTAATECKRKD